MRRCPINGKSQVIFNGERKKKRGKKNETTLFRRGIKQIAPGIR